MGHAVGAAVGIVLVGAVLFFSWPNMRAYPLWDVKGAILLVALRGGGCRAYSSAGALAGW